MSKSSKEYFKNYYLKNKDKIKENTKRYRSENMEKVKIQRQGYYQMNKEHIKSESIKQRKNNPNILKEYKIKNKNQIVKYNKIYKKNYRKTMRGKILIMESNIKRRHNFRKINHNFSQEELLNKILSTSGICPICNHKFNSNIRSKTISIDHNPPISNVQDGFSYTLDMVEIMCVSCNSIKKDKPLEVLYA